MCAVTGCTVTRVLEAAHLRPYRGKHTNHVTNGLLLRADIHTLLDYELLAPEPETRAVVISKLLVSTQYEELSGRKIAAHDCRQRAGRRSACESLAGVPEAKEKRQ